MAKSINNIVMQGASGRLGRLLVLKTYGDRTFITAAPDRSNVKLSEKQLHANSRFSKAVAFAKRMKQDPELFSANGGQVGKRQSVYHAALAWYLKNNNDNVSEI